MGWKRKAKSGGNLGAEGDLPEQQGSSHRDHADPGMDRDGSSHILKDLFFSVFNRQQQGRHNSPKILNTNTTKFFRKQQLLARARPSHSRVFYQSLDGNIDRRPAWHTSAFEVGAFKDKN